MRLHGFFAWFLQFTSTRNAIAKLHGPALLYAMLLCLALVLHLVALGTTGHGVSVQGDCVPASNQFQRQKSALRTAITHCLRGDTETGTQLDYVFPAGTKRINLAIFINGAADGYSLQLINQDDVRIALAIPSGNEGRVKETVLVPPSIYQEPFRLAAQAHSGSLEGRLDIKVNGYSSLAADLNALAVALLMVMVLHFIATELAAVLLRFDVGDQAPSLMLLVLGVLGFVAFWFYYFSRAAGIAFSVVFILGLVLHAVLRIVKPNPFIRQGMRSAQAVIAPVSSLVILLFILGFYPFPEHWADWQYAANRWRNLPIDNWLPKIFADQIWLGHVFHPMLGDWLSSDRPPLQAGIYLLLRPIVSKGRHVAEFYQLTSMWLQVAFLIPLASLIEKVHPQRYRALTMLLFSTSALVIYNGIFVWPKLLAAVFCIICYSLLFTSERPGAPLTSTHKAIWVGVAAALAMLSHGAAFFAIAPLFIVYFLRTGPRNWRALGLMSAAALAIYAPWIAYQRLLDPPGTRLLAWGLAGVENPLPLPIGTILRHAYASLSFSEWWHIRINNLQTIANGSLGFFQDAIHLFGTTAPAAKNSIMVKSFFYFNYAQWFFSPLLVAAAAVVGWPRVKNLLPELALMLACICIGLILWSLLMFSPGSTIIHQGAYFLNLMALLVASAVVCSCSRILYVTLCLANLSIFTIAFVLAGRATVGVNPPLPAFLQNASLQPQDFAYFLLLVFAVIAHLWLSRNAAASNPDYGVIVPSQLNMAECK